MKTAIIYYSYEGNGIFVAEKLGKLLNADILQIQLVNEKKYKGFLRILWGGSQVFSKKLPAIKPYEFNPDTYDLIIFGSPVWAGNIAPAIKTFLSQTKISGKKTALFTCHGGGPGKSMNKFKNMLKDNTIVSDINLVYPLKNKEKVTQQIEEWAKQITNIK
jgi:flavodoxin